MDRNRRVRIRTLPLATDIFRPVLCQTRHLLRNPCDGTCGYSRGMARKHKRIGPAPLGIHLGFNNTTWTPRLGAMCCGTLLLGGLIRR